ncbi:hypothetical protein ABEG10_21380 [Burkholderia cenocepacia]|uniref:hypothetical protein n=1 Tax=Burkholderia cenocepacia TaxID=95486 RepID=UPI00209D770F|nr:hypothetical protein [Burkholderia cenocepacia]MCO8320762.1 hypothetical protein [Burkholderia cenocepacia]MCO8328046.1 hypothetical protein [Burkholderia cenocepacia]MCO8335333.1 hypothetical protein [Burkholderia cenocepacia]MCO8342617.1 hypothetical protein [Burkholderia cenocepacia]MCO8355899.1 hypothetical protein [Burkholderia cenocepacia]
MQISAVRLVGLAALAFLLVGFSVHLARPKYDRCDLFEKELNGGKKEFGGVKYYAKLCGADIRNGHEVRFQLFDESGELRAQRYFSYYVNTATERELVDGVGGIVYYDSSSSDVMQLLAIPPTTWDWIRARLPLF